MQEPEGGSTGGRRGAAPCRDGRRREGAASGAGGRHGRRIVFRREGDCWTLAHAGGVWRLKPLRGFEHIAELLRHPHQEIDALCLAAGARAAEPGLGAAEIAASGLRIRAGSANDPVLDGAARAAYRARLHELQEEAAADARGAAARRREVDALTAHLAGAAGQHGGARRAPGMQERARLSVRNAIATALQAVKRHDQAVFRHLAASINTGTFCSYAPDEPVVWEL